MEPMVSICCAAYNHAPYIAEALDSFLAQERDFPIEILVHDDASTDGTADILRDYAARYPDVIRPLFETENQYSKGAAIDPTFNYPRARGKYIALCEGDDCWCDPRKLSRQVAWMEAHPDCTFCFTNGYIHDVGGSAPDREFIPYSEKDAAGYFAADHVYTLGDMCALNFVPTASFLFPRAALDRLPDSYWQKFCAHGDLKLRLFLTAAGYGVYLHAFTCVYRENVRTGAMSQWSRETGVRVYERSRSVADMLQDVDGFAKKRYTVEVGRFRDWYLYVMLWNAPTSKVLLEPDARRVYRALPLSKRLKYRLKQLAKPFGRG